MTSLDRFRLDGQVAVVIGGAGGLGAAMARGLAEAGAAVAVADADAGRATDVAAAIAKAGGRGLAVAVDVADSASVERMAAEVEDRLGPIDALVNRAGITHRGAAAHFPEAEWHRVIAVNLTGVFSRLPDRGPAHARATPRAHRQHRVDRRPDRAPPTPRRWLPATSSPSTAAPSPHRPGSGLTFRHFRPAAPTRRAEMSQCKT